MIPKKRRGSEFLVQGSILAIASIASRIIGLLYRIPMTAIIGNKGNDFYGSAFEVYNIMLIISSYSLPTAVSKFISGYRAVGDYKTVKRIYKVALALSLTSGIIAALIVFCGASTITRMLKSPLSVYALLVLAPALIILSVMGVIRGLFQGMGTMIPTAFSQIIEQIVNAIVSVTFAYILFNRGLKVGAVLGNSEIYASAFGAAGGTLGTTLGAFAGLIFIGFIFFAFVPVISASAKKQRNTETIPYKTLAKILILTIVPVLLSTTIYNISGIVDQGIFKNIMAAQSYTADEVSEFWGVYLGKYKLLINVPLAIASAMAASTVPELTAAFAQKDMKMARKKTYQATRFVMVIALPCVVGLAVLANPIMELLFKDSSELAANIMVAGAISVAFYSLSTLTNGILQGIDRLNEPVKNAIIALILHCIVLVVLLYAFDLNIYAVVYANAFYAFLMCVLNGLSIRRYSRYRQEILRTFIIPAIASIIMGVAIYYTRFGLMTLYSGRAIVTKIWTVITIFVGMFVYFIFLILLKGLNAEEMLHFPKGHVLLRISRKLHL
ncbi:MAG: polysaccharide biosynthesis protein, partial [Lachnospiraceae bacterium]|nr:polysaccharide biosynthesis protein [Lachnospiraceae bacterium]